MNLGFPSTLSPLEVAAGAVLEQRAHAPTGHARQQEVGGNPREALERSIVPALLRAPCLVSFSGGRDSSAVLAVATELARREGLPAPIPATNVFAGAPNAKEDAQQHRIIRHLGLEDWLRVSHTTELDLVGPYAQKVLDRLGLVWPPNVHFHVPLLEAARGGSLLTGIGGDELFASARRLRSAAVLRGAVRPRPRDALSVGFAYLPRALRQTVLARRQPVDAVWLRPGARRLLGRIVASHAAAEPRGVPERMAWWRSLRYLRVGLSALERTAEQPEVLLVHPLLSEQLWSAVAAVAAPIGLAGRTEGMRALFSDLLPAQTLARSGKAHFDEVLWSERSAEFARAWDGAGAPEEWVDSAALARHWRERHPSPQSFTLLQAAWLHAAARARAEADQSTRSSSPMPAAY